MKNTKWLALVASVALPIFSAHAQTPVAPVPATADQSQAAAVPSLSPSASEVVRLASAGSGDDVLLAYVQNSQSTFDLSADSVLYLKDVGVSSQVIAAMLNRDNALRSQAPAPTPPPPPVPVVQPTPAPVIQSAPPAPAPAPAYVSAPPADVTYFYSDLAPYGAWIEVAGYGWCWQPTAVVVNHGWRPYCDGGHWAYTDAGWCWVSDYSWGWAPFHYGRWTLHPSCGWVWLPDRVWGPAWVTWRTAGDYCGWAPLPPHAEFVIGLGWRFNGVHVGLDFDFGLRADHFAFIALKDFNDHDLGHRRLPATEVTRVYGRTTIINNYTVNNNRIVNQGVKVERVAAATHTQIRQAAIRDLPAGAPRGSRIQGSDKAGMVVYRPQLQASPVRTGNMVAQKVDERHPVIQHAAFTPAKASSPTVRSTAPTRGSTPAPAAAPGRSQAEVKQAPSRSAPERSAVRSAQPPAQPPASKAYAPAASQAQTAQRPGPQLHPLRSGAQSEPNAGQSAPRGSSPQYYPKSYHQAAEAHALPPLNPRTTAAPSSSGKDSQPGSAKKGF